MDDGSPRIRAARWVITLGRLYGGLLAVAAAWSLLGVVFLGSPAALVVPLLLTGAAFAWGALVREFEAHRRGAWQLLVGLAAVAAAATVAGWLTGVPVTALGLLSTAADGVLLALLVHPDSREWVARDEPEQLGTAELGSHPGGGQ